MKTFNIKLILFFGLLFFSSTVQAQDELLYEPLSVKARAFQDSIVIRWTPNTYDIWRLGMEKGYRIFLRKTATDGQSSRNFISETIFPMPENSWGSSDPDDVMGLAHALLYNFDQPLYEGAQGAFTEQEDRENRHGFMLFAADMSLPAAKNMGLSYTDTNIEAGYTYEYKIYIVDADIQSYYGFVDPANIPPLPKPDALQVIFGDEEFHLGWLKDTLEQYYSSYDIEFSTDQGASFTKMNKKPFVSFESAEANLPQEYIFFRDSINNYIEEYQFRVIGHSPFGETGPPSDIVSGKGKPSPLAILPRITEVIGMEDSTFTINWRVNNDFVDSIVGFNILRYEDFPGLGEYINADILSPETRTFHDENPFLVNHYQVEAVDINGYPYTTTAALAQITDSIPPLTPSGLTGLVDTIIDSIFVIKLHWSPNQEEDLAGYHIFTSNSPNLEFANLTSSGQISDTLFFDTLPSLTLAENAYYKIKAIDFTGNISSFSPLFTIERPDLIPPVPPNLSKTVEKSTAGLTVGWINSPSKDVVSYELQRKLAYSADDWLTIASKAKSNLPNDKVLDDEITKVETIYWYRVITTDDAGLQSISDTLKVAPVPTEKKHIAEIIFDLDAAIREQQVFLSWMKDNDPTIKKVLIYRSVNNGQLKSLMHIPIGKLSNNAQGRIEFIDNLIQPGDRYLYKIQYRYNNGESSNISGKATVHFE